MIARLNNWRKIYMTLAFLSFEILRKAVVIFLLKYTGDQN